MMTMSRTTPTRVKICGVAEPETLDAAVGGGASDIGLVFYPPSPRNLSYDLAASLAARIPDHVGRVGVFVNPDDPTLNRAVTSARLTTIQLHQTAPARVAEIRARFALDVWAAIAIRTRRDLETVRSYGDAADRILYDAKTPPGSLPGGMGVRFDWSLLVGFTHPLPWLLSGGLDANNVTEAIDRTNASIVDVSSGVESAPGVKNVDKIAAFLKAARA